jgi:hypothetical protein
MTSQSVTSSGRTIESEFDNGTDQSDATDGTWLSVTLAPGSDQVLISYQVGFSYTNSNLYYAVGTASFGGGTPSPYIASSGNPYFDPYAVGVVDPETGLRSFMQSTFQNDQWHGPREWSYEAGPIDSIVSAVASRQDLSASVKPGGNAFALQWTDPFPYGFYSPVTALSFTWSFGTDSRIPLEPTMEWNPYASRTLDIPHGVEGQPYTEILLNFLDHAGATTADDYTAEIYWGDSPDPTPGTISGNPLHGFDVSASHVYQEGLYGSATVVSTFIVRVRVVSSDRRTFGYDEPLPILDAPLTAIPTSAFAVIEKGQAGAGFSDVVGSFRDGSTLAPLTEYTAMIDWGDGSPAGAATFVPGDVPGVVKVQGSHHYDRPGLYDTVIAVQDRLGQGVLSYGTLSVVDSAFLSGRFDPTSDTGVSNSDGITSDATPTFHGDAPAGYVVDLYASTLGASVLVGSAVSDDRGHWSITSNSLAEGSYRFFVTATEPESGGQWSANVPVTDDDRPLVIDTTAPVVVAIAMQPKHGTVWLVFQDAVGLATSSLTDPNHYLFERRRPRHPQYFHVSAVSAGGLHTVPVTLKIGSRGRIGPGLRYVLTARSGTITDLAGIRSTGNSTLQNPAETATLAAISWSISGRTVGACSRPVPCYTAEADSPGSRAPQPALHFLRHRLGE